MIDYRVYLITDTQMCGERGVVWTVSQAIAGGVTLVQVRDPKADDESFLKLARKVVEICRPNGVPVILNDRVHLVAPAQAQGAHIGQSDLPVTQARKLLPNKAVLGLSINTEAQLNSALAYGDQLDYLGIGPIWAQQTKLDAAAPIGLAGLAKLVAESPWATVAIGGINVSNIADVRRTGADGGAVVSAICGSKDPKASAQALVMAGEL